MKFRSCLVINMKIAIISDTHDNWPYIDKVCEYFKNQNINTLLHCGDVCAPITLIHLAEEFPGEIHWVLGNVDGDPYLMVTKTADAKNLNHYGAVVGELELDGKKIALQHYPKLARGLAFTGDYTAVFYGHDHTQHKEYIEVQGKRILLANPGNLCDIKNPASFGIYETKENSIEIISLKDI